MVPDLFFHQLVLIALVWLYFMLHGMWPSDSAACPITPEPPSPLPKRTREPTPFAGLTHKPPVPCVSKRLEFIPIKSLVAREYKPRHDILAISGNLSRLDFQRGTRI
jgi:hypothetical protein